MLKGKNFGNRSSYQKWRDVLCRKKGTSSISFSNKSKYLKRWSHVFHIFSVLCLLALTSAIFCWESQVLAFLWMPLDINHPLKHPCSTIPPPIALAHPDYIGPPARRWVLPHRKNWSRVARGTWQWTQSVDLASKFHRSQSDWWMDSITECFCHEEVYFVCIWWKQYVRWGLLLVLPVLLMLASYSNISGGICLFVTLLRQLWALVLCRYCNALKDCGKPLNFSFLSPLILDLDSRDWIPAARKLAAFSHVSGEQAGQPDFMPERKIERDTEGKPWQQTASRLTVSLGPLG